MCCGGIKKVFLAAGFVAALLAVLTMTKVGSYARTAYKQARESAVQQVPIEFEIERLKNEVGQLIPDLKKNLSVVAEQMAAIERGDKEVATIKGNMEKQEASLRKMAQDLLTTETSFVYEGKMFNRDQVARKFELDRKAYKIAQSELKNKEQYLEYKKRELDAAKARLDSVRDQERSLKLEIAELEADLQTVRLAETRNRFQVDDSRLGDIKKSIGDLRFRLDKEKKTAILEAEYFGNDFGSSVDKPAPRPISEVAREVLQELDGGKVAGQ